MAGLPAALWMATVLWVEDPGESCWMKPDAGCGPGPSPPLHSGTCGFCSEAGEPSWVLRYREGHGHAERARWQAAVLGCGGPQEHLSLTLRNGLWPEEVTGHVHTLLYS